MKKILALILMTLYSCQPLPAGVVANTLYAEARSEGQKGILAVATVIWNRAHLRGISFEEVCLQRKQFSCWNNGYYNPRPKNKLEQDILKFCEGIESQMNSGTFRPSGNWTHYHTISINPKWSTSNLKKTQIGNHLFMKTN